jgi:hypothetical protein
MRRNQRTGRASYFFRISRYIFIDIDQGLGLKFFKDFL